MAEVSSPIFNHTSHYGFSKKFAMIFLPYDKLLAYWPIHPGYHCKPDPYDINLCNNAYIIMQLETYTPITGWFPISSFTLWVWYLVGLNFKVQFPCQKFLEPRPFVCLRSSGASLAMQLHIQNGITWGRFQLGSDFFEKNIENIMLGLQKMENWNSENITWTWTTKLLKTKNIRIHDIKVDQKQVSPEYPESQTAQPASNRPDFKNPKSTNLTTFTP